MPNTNSWLCIYAIAQLGRPYRLGASGDFEVSSKRKLYQNNWEVTSTTYPNPNYNVPAKTHDCSGLFIGAVCCDDVNGPKVRSTNLYHGATKQYWDFCTHKGDNIHEFPRIPGMLVFRSKSAGSHTKEHVGVYIGRFIDLNGNPHEDYVIDAKGKDYGVVMGPLFRKDGSSRWDCWGQLDMCEQDTNETSIFDARTNSMRTDEQQEAGELQPVEISTENMKPFVATVLGQYDPKLDYDRIRNARISAMMFYAGELFDVSHVKHTYLNPKLAYQVEQCNSAGLPYALYVNVRARNEIEADAECKALYYVISQFSPKLGLWLSLNLNNSVDMNNKIVSIYYKFIYSWGLVDRCGLYVTRSQLQQITWENFENVFYLWCIEPEDVNNIDDELLDPSLFDINPEDNEIESRYTEETSKEVFSNASHFDSPRSWLPNLPKSDESGRFTRSTGTTSRFVRQEELDEQKLEPLYTTRTDRHDMTLRQVGYLDTGYNLSNNSSNIAISVINYTSALGDIYDSFAPTVSQLNSTKVDTSALPQLQKIAIDKLLEAGYSASSATGIVACLEKYSGLNTQHAKTIQSVTLHGIGDWYDQDFDALKSAVSDWSTNLSGQLDFLITNITERFSGYAAAFKYQPLDVETAQKCAEIFLLTYNPYFSSNEDVENVKHKAQDIYERLVIIPPNKQIIGELRDLTNINGQLLTAQYSVTIPPELKQTGITDYYTAYWRNWKSGTPQRQLYDIWIQQGRPCDKGIAKIGGYYCVALMTEKFGPVGSVVVISLKNEVSFPAIIADAKGVDAKNEWGHDYGKSGISIVEWERIKTENGVCVKGGSSLTGDDVDYPHTPSWMKEAWEGWYLEDVAFITNYGSYI